MKEEYADLHVHTYYSDSTFSPEEVLKYAAKEHLKAIAICDHDCVDGIGPTIKLAKKYDIEIIPAVELTIDIENKEVHILGYFVDWKSRAFRNKLKTIEKSRVDRIYKMAKLLKAHGVDVSSREIFDIAHKGTAGRLHVAFAMLKAGNIRNIREAFDKYIGFTKPCYVPHMKFEPEEAIKIILDAGGVPVLAHPKVIGRDEYIEEFVKYGLRGVEVYHTDHRDADEDRYLKIAKKNNLVVVGGSDCHGLGKGRVLIGTVKVPYALVEKLREEADRIKHEKR